jgi:hypothetical protein
MSLDFIWRLFFVIGVLLFALSSASGSPNFAWGPRVAWVLWAVAAIIWLVAGRATA